MQNTNHTYPNPILVHWKAMLWKVTVLGAVCAIMGCSPHQTPPKPDDSPTPTTQASPTSQETTTTRKNTPHDSFDSRASQSTDTPKESSSPVSSASSATKRSSTSTAASRVDGEFSTKRSDSTAKSPLRQADEPADTVAADDNTTKNPADGQNRAGTTEKTNPAEESRKILLTELEASLEIAERKAMRESDYGEAYRLLVITFAKLQAAQNEQNRQERLGVETEFSPELQAREATFERRLQERLKGYADRANEIAKRQMDLESDQTPLVMQGS